MQMIMTTSTAGIMIMMGSGPGDSVSFMEFLSIDVATVEGRQQFNHSFPPGLITVLKSGIKICKEGIFTGIKTMGHY